MRNRRSILFFLFWSAVFAAALCLLPDFNRSADGSPDARLSNLDAGGVVRVDINRADAETGAMESVVMLRADGVWRIEAPVAAEADESSVKRLLDSMMFAEGAHSLSESDMAALGRSLRDFGLAQPRCTVTVSDGDARDTFSIGRKTAFGDEVYALRKGRKGVFTIPAGVADELMRPLKEFRRRGLFRFKPSEVVGLGLKDAGEPMTRLAKTEGQWRISNPMDAPADRQAVEELIGELCSAQIVDYAADAAASHGLGDDEGFAVSLRDTFGAVEKVVFGACEGTNAVWVLTPEGAVVRVDSKLLEWCRSRHKALEDTRIFPAEASQVVSLSLTEGFPAYVATRRNSASPWVLVSPVDAAADSRVVEQLLAKVLSLRGVELVPEGSDGALTVSLGTSFTNFNARCVFGNMMLQDVRLEDMLDKTVFRCRREQIKNIQVRTAAGDAWNAKSLEDVVSLVESGIIADRVETIVLRAKDFERCGFAHPAYTISFELTDGVSPLRRMLIGSATPNGDRYATIGGIDAVFMLPASVVSVLTKPVEDAMEEGK